MITYHYITVNIVMRDCDNEEDAKAKCSILLPQYPDENTQHMESWEIVKVDEFRIRGTRMPDNE